MSTRYVSRKRAAVKSVLKRKPLVRAIAWALMAGSMGISLSAQAATIQGIKFNDLTGDTLRNWYLNANGECKQEPIFPSDSVSIRDLTLSVTSTVTTTSEGRFSYESSGQDFRLWTLLPSSDWARTIPQQTYFSVSANGTGEPITVNFGIRDTTLPLATVCDPNSPPSNASSISNTFISSVSPEKGFAPSASVGESEKIAFEGKEISLQGNFSDTDVNQTHTFAWDFGDGETANTQSVSHTYKTEGKYIVTFAVTDSGGETGQATMSVKVFRNDVTLLDGVPVTEHSTVNVADYYYDAPSGQKTFERIEGYLFVANKPGKTVSLSTTSPLPDSSNFVGFGNLYKFATKEALTDATQKLSLDTSNVEYISPLLVTQEGEVLLVTNEVVLKRPATVNEGTFKTAAMNAGLTFVRKLRLTEDMYLFKMTASYNDVATVFKATRDARDLPQVDWAEPNFLVKPIRDYTPSEMSSSTYDLWHLDKIAAPAAWDKAKGEGTVIAINDDGVQWDHPDLKDNIWTNPLEIENNGIDDDNNGYVDDIHGWNFYQDDYKSYPQVPGLYPVGDYHGTSVAGVAAAVGDNSTIGNGGHVVGSAMKAKILPIRVFDGDPMVANDKLAESIYYEATYAHVANHSWKTAYSAVVEEAIKKAVKGTMNSGTVRGTLGVPMIFSSSNDYKSTVSFPASTPEAIAVGASTNDDVRSGYSNYGSALDVVAPSNGGSKGIATTDRQGGNGMGTGDYYLSFGGTSSAAPLTAGVAAVLLSHNPTLTAKQVDECLKKGAEKIGPVAYSSDGLIPSIGTRHNEYGYGRVNMLKTLDACADPCQTPDITSTGTGDWVNKVSSTSTSDKTVKIKAGHSVTANSAISVKNLCVEEGGKLLGKQGSKLDITANGKIQNAGLIQAASGFNSTSSGRDGQKLELFADNIINKPTGYIQAGKGYDDVNLSSTTTPAQGGKGGDVNITAVNSFNDGTTGNLFNEGTIGPVPMVKQPKTLIGGCSGPSASNTYHEWVIASSYPDYTGGNGGIGRKWNGVIGSGIQGGNGSAIGGNAGSIDVQNVNYLLNKGRISNGYGGNAYRRDCSSMVLAGTGSKMNITPASGATVLNLGQLDGAGGFIWIEPIAIELSGSNMRIYNSTKVVIFGGDDAVLKLNNLNPEAIVADETITIAVGKGGVVDLTGNAAKVFKAGQKVEIFADNILLDEGVTLQTVSDSPIIETHPSKILYHVTLSNTSQTVATANSTIPVSIKVSNGGPTTDTYTLSITSQNGWTVSGLPATVTVDGLKQTELNFNVTLPAEGSDVITITATSQADSTVVATTQIQATVEKPVVVEPEKVALTVSKVDEGTVTAEGIDCGEDCTEDYAINTEVKLTATPANGYQFTNWSGDCASDTLTMDAAKSCSAQFTAVLYTTHGTLLDKAGKPLSGVTISTNDKTVTTNDAGNWEINDLTIGDYTFSATKEGYIFSNAAITLEGENTSQSVDIMVLSEPQGPYTTAGTLLDKAGNPIANATVQVGDKTTMTDELGNWSIDGLFEGKYDIVATKDNFNCLNTDFELGNNDYHQVVDCELVTSLKMIVKPSSYAALAQGDTLTYTIDVVNGGEQTATGVTLTNLLPEGTSLVALESAEAQCDNTTLICTLPDLAMGHTARIKLTLRADQANTVKTSMTLTSNEYPVDVKQNFKAVKPYLSVTLTDTPDPVVMQGGLHYQAVVELSALAPETTATGINLTMQLPKGTELVDVNTEYGNCDSSAFPTIVCQLNDLSVASADSISRAIVDMNVKLLDEGLLVLTHEAKVSATNYPAYTDRERTNIVIPPNAIADIVLVVDTTKSMDEELNGIIASIEKFIQEQVGKGGIMPKVALVEFKDNVVLRAFTDNMDTLLKAVRGLTVEGGGLCPEASAEALNLAVDHTKEGGIIVFSTDASPYPDADMAALAERIKEKGIVLKALVSGDCGSGTQHWNDAQAELAQ